MRTLDAILEEREKLFAEHGRLVMRKFQERLTEDDAKELQRIRERLDATDDELVTLATGGYGA